EPAWRHTTPRSRLALQISHGLSRSAMALITEKAGTRPKQDGYQPCGPHTPPRSTLSTVRLAYARLAMARRAACPSRGLRVLVAGAGPLDQREQVVAVEQRPPALVEPVRVDPLPAGPRADRRRRDAEEPLGLGRDRESTRLNSSHVRSSYAGFRLKKKNE